MLKKTQEQNKRKLSDFFMGSFFIRLLLRIGDFLWEKTGKSLIGGIMKGYDKVTSAFQNCILARIFRKLSIPKRIGTPGKRAIARAIGNSRILGYLQKKGKRFWYYPGKAYGIFFLSAGTYTLVAYFFLRYAVGLAIHDGCLFAGGALMALSIPLLFARETMAKLLLESRIAGFLLFGFLGVSRELFEKEEKVEWRPHHSFFVGGILGIVLSLVEPLYIALGMMALLGGSLLLILPEAGVVLLFFMLPFLSTKYLIVYMLCLTICFFLKYIRGKRTIHFGVIDYTVFLFLFLVGMGAVISASGKDALYTSAVWICFMLGYFLTVNLIKTSAWTKRCVAALLSSSFLVSVYGLVQNFTGQVNTTWQDKEMFDTISGRVVSTFENPNVLGEYLLLTIPFAFAALFCAKGGKQVLGMLGLCACAGGCLIFTWSRGAWLGFLFAAVVFLLILSRRSISLMVCGVLAVPFLPFVLPSDIVARFTSIGSVGDSSTAYRLHIWTASLNMIRDYPIGGVGTSISSFQAVYPQYSLSGIESAPHSHNLFMEIMIELGVVGLVAFLLVIFFFLQKSTTVISKGVDRRTKLFGGAAVCAILGVLLQGMTDYVWYNYRIFLMFWLVIGLGVAHLRCYQAEKNDPLPSDEYC